MYSIGIDIGGTSIKAAAFDGRQVLGSPLRYPTLSGEGENNVRETVDRAVRELTAAHGEGLVALGVGTPGLVDERGYLAGDAVNIPGWKQVQIRDYLEERWHVPASVANDVNMTAYGVWRLGAGRRSIPTDAGQRGQQTGEPVRSLVCISLGTGIGGGIIIGGSMLVGAGGMAGEIGHVVVEEGGRRCNCGLAGCLERYSSATGIRETARILAKDFDSTLARRIAASEDERFPSAREVYDALAKGDRLARAVHEDSSRHLARAVGILAQTVNPEVIVFGGGVLEAGEVILEGIRRRLSDYVMPMSLSALDIRRAELGEAAGVWGAAVKAWDDLSR
jgi:glucokinase